MNSVDRGGRFGGRAARGLFHLRPLLEPLSAARSHRGRRRPSSCATTSTMCRSSRSSCSSQHFSAIAAAGPIVGPILAGLMFGWLPALLWILVGSIFIGGVHDMTALVASIRHKARSIAEVVRDHMSRLSYICSWCSSGSRWSTSSWRSPISRPSAFVGGPEDVAAGHGAVARPAAVTAETISESGRRHGRGDRHVVAAVPGAADRHGPAAAVHAAVARLGDGDLRAAGGRRDLDRAVHAARRGPDRAALPAGAVARRSRPDRAKDLGRAAAGLLPGRRRRAGVAAAAAARPLGRILSLRRRSLAGAVGVLFGGFPIQYDAFKGWDAVGKSGETFFPFLFITIACGACSGFHSLIASGTTSKQLRCETDARPIGYGAMLLEAMVATLALPA